MDYLQGLSSLLLLSSKKHDRKALLNFTAIKMIHMGPGYLPCYFKCLGLHCFFPFAEHYFNSSEFAQVFYLPAKHFTVVFSILRPSMKQLKSC